MALTAVSPRPFPRPNFASPADSSDDSDGCGHRHKQPARPPGVPAIGPDDYFARNAPFARWLQRKRGLYFDKLAGDKARALFAKFTRRWNHGDLDAVRARCS